MRFMFLLSLPALVACNSGIGGYWSGQLTCPGEDGTYEIDVDLDRDEGSIYTGNMTVEITEYVFSGGDDYEIWIETQFDTQVDLEGNEAQKLDYRADVESAECKGWVNGDLESSSCEEIGFDIGLGEEAELGTWRWDGEDKVTISDEGCEGTLSR